MKYIYYPGCSLHGNGRSYEESLLAVFGALDVPLDELDDWNCCGATAYMAIDEPKAFALAARNLALAEAPNGDGDQDIHLVAPCNACYLVLSKAQRYMSDYESLRDRISDGLNQAGLTYRGHVTVRHPLDVLLNDVGLEAIATRVEKPLDEWRVASYYGCQMVRPFATFDDRHDPQTMDRIVESLGAEPVDWSLKTRCCGGSLTGTLPDVGLRLNQILLKEAKRQGATVMITACPLCQFNLECYQDRISRRFGESVHMPVVYFTQLMGLAFGLPARDLGLHRQFTPLTASHRATQEVSHAGA